MEDARRLTMGQVLPHRGDMVLLDELLDVETERVSCAVTIRPDSPFCEPGKGVPSWVGIEYMAQTACTLSGAIEANAGMPASICLLLGARRYRAEEPYFPIGARLRVVADLQFRDENDLVAFACTIYSDRAVGDSTRRAEEIVVARGDIKAYKPKDVMAVVRGDRI